MTADGDDTRSRILRSAVDCAGRVGLGGLTAEDVARRAGVARATLYRHFPGGRDEVVAAAVAEEVSHFFRHLAVEVEVIDGLAGRLERGLTVAQHAVGSHEVLQRVLEAEPEKLMLQLSESAPLVKAVVREYLRSLLDQERLRPGVDPDEAADWLARHVLSLIVGPGVWRLDDPAEVRRLVRGYLLAGVLDDPGDPNEPVASLCGNGGRST